jgi:hypothetical protein
MQVPVIDLIPSAAGWYFTPGAPLVRIRPLRFRPASRAPGDQPPMPPAILGYGPDGRVSPFSPPPTLWILV